MIHIADQNRMHILVEIDRYYKLSYGMITGFISLSKICLSPIGRCIKILSKGKEIYEIDPADIIRTDVPKVGVTDQMGGYQHAVIYSKFLK